MSDQERQTPLLLPNGVSSSDGRLGVISSAAGGIDALEMQSGATLWHCDEVLEPMLVLESRVLARGPSERADSMRIVEVDALTGQLTGAEYELRFPEWTLFTDPSCQDFEYELSAEQEKLVLRWSVHCEYRGGAPASRAIAAKKRQHIAGVSTINTRTHEAEVLPTQVPEEPSDRASDALGESVSYQFRGKWRERPFKSAALSMELTSVGDALQLNRWGAVASQPQSVTLLSGEWFAPAVTPDGAYVVVQSGTAGQPQAEWQVFRLASGEKVISFQSSLRPERPCVVASRLHYLTTEPGGVAELWARDLTSGDVLWTKPLSAPTKRATPPPLRR